jgi:hypothetical protein
MAQASSQRKNERQVRFGKTSITRTVKLSTPDDRCRNASDACESVSDISDSG